tara:strand:+ start:771 stop:989 length:219 start_codon:yes stop_codon:yes gene_type:complete
MKNESNLIDFDQILHSDIFPILSPKFSKNHDFKIPQNRIKFNQKIKILSKSFKFDHNFYLFLVPTREQTEPM